jgi:hypothetical protein
MLQPIPSPRTTVQVEDQRRSIQRDMAELTRLLDSRGWAIINEVMRQEMHDAAIGLASSTNMTKDEIDFRRGNIWTAKQLLELPQKLLARLEGEALFLPQPPTTDKTE